MSSLHPEPSKDVRVAGAANASPAAHPTTARPTAAPSPIAAAADLTPFETNPLALRLAVRIALLFVLFGLLWFGVGEYAIAFFSPATGRLPLSHSVSAWLFIAITTVLLFLLAHHFIRALQLTQEKMNATFQSIAEQYRRLFERNPSAMIIYDPDTKQILAANDVSLLLYGYSREKFLTMTTLDLVIEDQWPRAIALSEAYRSHSVESTGQFQVRRGDGKIITIEAITHEVDFDGKPARIALVTDITNRLRTEQAIIEHRLQLEQRVADRTAELSLANQRLREQIAHRMKMEEELRAATSIAQSANEAKTAFLANTSHEIRTPLTSIIGYSDLLADATLLPSERAKYLGIVSQNAQHLLALIDDLIDLSRAEAGVVRITLNEHSPMEIARQAALLLEQRATIKQIAIHLRFDPSVPGKFRTDGVRLRQILLNLLNNAIKFTEQGTVTLTAKQEPTTAGPMLHFHVADTGIGIPSEHLPRIFEPFFQVEHRHMKRLGGFGLGLAISRQLARQLGGDITVVSAPGKGSTFTLALPLSPADIELPSPKEIAPVTAQALDGHILFAEDNAAIRMLVEEYLTRAGARVTTAVNGREALELIEQSLAVSPSESTYDLVLLDKHMPVLDGESARRFIRAAGYRGPIVGLTADFSGEAAEQWTREGWDAIAPKPIDRNAFIPLLARLLAQSPSRQSAPTISVDDA